MICRRNMSAASCKILLSDAAASNALSTTCQFAEATRKLAHYDSFAAKIEVRHQSVNAICLLSALGSRGYRVVVCAP